MTTTTTELPATTEVSCRQCGGDTIPPTPGTKEEGFYCETCGIAWRAPAAD